MSTDSFKSDEIVTQEIIGDNLDLTSSYVRENLSGKKGMILLAYADFCGACKKFKPEFIKFMRNYSKGDLVIKALPINEQVNAPLMAKMAKWNKDNKVKYKIEFIPIVLSFDSKGRFFSIYGNSLEYPEEKIVRKNNMKEVEYRKEADLNDYAKTVGDYTVDFKILKDK